MRDPVSKITILNPKKKPEQLYTRNDLVKAMNEIGVKGDRWSTLRRYEKLGLIRYPNRFVENRKGKVYLLTKKDIDWNLKEIAKYKESKDVRRRILKKARREGIRIYPTWQ